MAIIASNIKTVSSEYPREMVKDFNFEIQLKSNLFVVNSYKNTLTKGIKWDSDTTITFTVTDEWKKKIYTALASLDIYKYPENYAPTTTITVLPSFDYSITFTLNEKTTTVNWAVNTESNEREAIALRKFFDSIYNDLMEYTEIQSLPNSERFSL